MKSFYRLLLEGSNEDPRLERAIQMGFDISKTYYHGSANLFSEFKKMPSLRGGGGLLGAFGGNYEAMAHAFFFTDDINTAWAFADNRYGELGNNRNILKVYLKTKKTLDLTKKNRKTFDILNSAGYDVEQLYGVDKEAKTREDELKDINQRVKDIERELKRPKQAGWAKFDNFGNMIAIRSDYKEGYKKYEQSSENYESSQKYNTQLLQRLQLKREHISKGKYSASLAKNISLDIDQLFDVLDQEEVVKNLISMNYDSVKVKEENGTTSIAVFYSNQIRSINAKFDINKKESGNIYD